MAPDNPGLSGTTTAVPLPSGRLRGMLARGEAKAALNQAKELHKSVGTAESESLLVECYLARARELQARRLSSEADVLLKIVQERWPHRLPQLEQAQVELAARNGSLDPLLARLQQVDLAADERNRLETLVRHHLSDLRMLADLPPEHPWKAPAAQLQQAFETITRGPLPGGGGGGKEPIQRSEIRLPEVSRRSPLAPWRLLVRALLAFYERDDAECERCLQAIDRESPPARLVPTLRAAMTGQPGGGALAVQLGSGSLDACRKSWAALDALFAKGQGTKVLSNIPEAIRQCLALCPDQVDALRQHISVRCVGLALPPERVLAALGAPSRKDATFWRLLARHAEKHSQTALFAGAAWHEFSVHARAERKFQTPFEQAALYLHMASLLTPLGEYLEPARRDFLRSHPGFKGYYADQPPEIVAAGQTPEGRLKPAEFLNPAVLFARAAALDPDVSVFEPWFDWARTSGSATAVAEQWHGSRPTDLTPLLHLAEAAEERGALRKAEAFLASAEALNPLHPQVRGARVRVQLNTLKRHAQKRQYHLCDKDVARLRTLQPLQDGDGSMLLAAVDWAQSLAERKRPELPGPVMEKMGPVGARLLLQAVARLYGLRDAPWPSTPSCGPAAAGLELARACQMAERFGLQLDISAALAGSVEAHLAGEAPGLIWPLREAIACQAVKAELPALVHAATRSGLHGDPAQQARSLLLRARSLPRGHRRGQCLTAAAELARRTRDDETLRAAVDLARHTGHLPGYDDAQALALGEAAVQRILAFEQQATVGSTVSSSPALPVDDEEDDDPALEDLLELVEATTGGKLDVEELLLDFPEIADLPPSALASLLEAMARMADAQQQKKRRARR